MNKSMLTEVFKKRSFKLQAALLAALAVGGGVEHRIGYNLEQAHESVTAAIVEPRLMSSPEMTNGEQSYKHNLSVAKGWTFIAEMGAAVVALSLAQALYDTRRGQAPQAKTQTPAMSGP